MSDTQVNTFYVCDFCARNTKDLSMHECMCLTAKGAILKPVISDGQKYLDVCLWFLPKRFTGCGH